MINAKEKNLKISKNHDKSPENEKTMRNFNQKNQKNQEKYPKIMTNVNQKVMRNFNRNNQKNQYPKIMANVN
jgi:hypothetical protein